MSSQKIDLVPEIKLQKAVHSIVSNPSVVWRTVKGNRLQFLSPGRLNSFEGPDFIDAALLIDGTIFVGDTEFHKKSSLWKFHRHDEDERYDKVILHIVMDDDYNETKSFEKIIIGRDELAKELESLELKDAESDLSSLEDLQDYALIRLLRRSVDAKLLLNRNDIRDTLNELAYNYIKRYNTRRKRPVYNPDRLDSLLSKISSSELYNFLCRLQSDEDISVPDIMQNLVKTKISDEGTHLRRELILNCVLPAALCLANDNSRISLFLWYWSTPALFSYGGLTRRFPYLPQNFLWQQQGMLEYIKEQGRKPGIVSDTIKDYGFAEILTFYKLGSAPFRSELSEIE
jgi:hypothetical protein